MNCLTTALYLFLMYVPFNIHANEAHLQESSGFLSLVDGDSTNISMVSEHVVIELGKTNYTVDASFEFLNEDATATLLVGFPDYGYGYIGTFKGVKTNYSFETWVNDVPTALSRRNDG